MNKEKELIKSTAIITFGKICTQFISFLLLPLYTAVLSTSEYGTVDLIITYSSFALPFSTLALEQALFRFLIDVRDNEEKCGKYITTTVFISFSISVTIFIATIIINFFINSSLFFYFGLVLMASTISATSLQIFRGLGDNVGYALSGFISALGQILCNILFLVWFHYGVSGMMLASFVGNIICGIVAYFRCDLKKYIKFKYFDRKIFKELSAYSLPLIPNQLSWWALNASDKVIVQFFIGVAGNGLVAVANKFSSVYISFSNIFNISWTESVTLHIHDRDAKLFISKTINSVYCLFLSACCSIIAIMPFVFPIMVNTQYKEAYGLIPIFMVSSLFNAVVSLYGVIYVAYKKTVEIAKTAIYAALLNIISHLVLIRIVGIYASALSTMIGYGGMALYRYFHSRKYIVIKFNSSTLFLSVFMLTISCIPYYCNNRVFQAVGLIMIFFLCCIVNKDMISAIMKTLKKKMGMV